jgi:hypothetical protein
MKDKLWTRQIINYSIYTTAGVIYGLFGTEGAGTSGILLLPIILFTILLFIFNLSFTYLGQIIFKEQRQLLFALLTPQLIGLLIFIILLLRDQYIIDNDSDKVLWGFLVLTTILNIWTYFTLRPKKQ